jgi:hypothetical protein
VADPRYKELAYAALAQTAVNPNTEFIRATPRNAVLGYLADVVGSTYSPQRTQQMQEVANFFSAPAISNTLNRLAYGEPLTTGAGGIGGTTRLRPDTIETALALGPMLPPMARGVSSGVAAVGKRLEPAAGRMAVSALERGGLPAEMVKAMANNTEAKMIKTPSGQIPETASDVKKLSERFGRLLDDAGVEYSYEKSNLSPARYFTFDNPASPLDSYTVRISDHRNVHGADYSVDPHTGATFEEMLKSVKNMGVPISDKVLPKNTIPDQVRKLQNQLLNGEYIKIAAKSLPEGASRSEIFAAAKPLETELYAIANLEKSQLTREHLNRLKQLLGQQLKENNVDASLLMPGNESALTILERNGQPVQLSVDDFKQGLANFMK